LIGLFGRYGRIGFARRCSFVILPGWLQKMHNRAGVGGRLGFAIQVVQKAAESLKVSDCIIELVGGFEKVVSAVEHGFSLLYISAMWL
jgi:hypothetical protein